MKLYNTLCLLWCFFGFGKCANILAVINGPTYSHYSLGVKLVRPLAEKGHNVTFASAFSLENPPKTWNEIVFDDLGKSLHSEEGGKMLYEMSGMNSITKELTTQSIGLMLVTTFMEHPSFQKLLNSNVKYDVIIFERFMNEPLLGLSHHFQAPYILLGTIGYSRWLNDITGNPGSPSYLPDIFLDYTCNMNLWQRFYNSLFYIFAEIWENFVVLRSQQKLLEKYFPNAPSIQELYTNASIVFVNTHPAVKYATPSVPNMVEIGGYHISPPKKLPEDLQKFLDSAPNGVIYFSLGSALKSKDMPVKTRDAFLKVFSKLKQKVLWKFEVDPTFVVPPNVKLGKWLPQQDLLTHPNIKVFITHGGLLSTIEAVHHGVPMLALPIFAEQYMNAAETEEYGYGLHLPFNKFKEEKFEQLLHEVINNPKYRENIKQRSKVFKDQQTTPIERVIFWVEYVIRNKGAPYLKSVTLNLSWYQYLLLDVLILVAVILFSVYFVLKTLLKLICGKKKNVPVNKNKKNR